MENPLKDMDFTTIQPGDVLVARPKRQISMAEMEEMRDAVAGYLRDLDIRMIVMPYDVEVSVLRPNGEV